MKITVLTSSRADYSIYLPLLRNLEADPYFDLDLVVFGAHLSETFGKTVNEIEKDGFVISERINTMPDGDMPTDIALSIGDIIKSFSRVWEKHKTDLIVALGDRYEMFGACVASVPFGLPVAHIHGGEVTQGAIDDIFRHSITQIAKYHFVTTEQYTKKVIALKGSSKNVYNVGALSIDNLNRLELLSQHEFKEKFDINLSIPTILITFHPETVEYSQNEIYIDEIIDALNEVKNYQFVITMPNADTMGKLIRDKLFRFIQNNPLAIGIESLGTIGYLTCMKYCSFMLGNTSSGFVEASYFPKYVINLGHRQDGRIVTRNIKNCEIKKEKILDAINQYPHFSVGDNVNIYGYGDTAEKMIEIFKAL